jgi:glycerophosphoryl diester phosphodiesterase
MSAFATGLELGADGLELDLQLSKDGVPVVYHDRTLHKVGSRGRIPEHDLAQLRELDVGRWFAPRFAGERMPTLDEVLDKFGGRCDMLLELKPDGEPAGRVAALVDAVLRAVARRKIAARTRLLCFDGAVLERVRRADPKLACVRNVDARPDDTRLARTLGAAAVLCLPARAVDPELAAGLRRRGRGLFVYRCDTPRNLVRALRCTVDGIITDRPDWLRAQLGSAAPAPRAKR